MEQRVSLITLGVENLQSATAFYERLQWKKSDFSNDDITFFQVNGFVLSLYSILALARDMGEPVAKKPSFSGISLAYNVPNKPEVVATLQKVEKAGGKIIKQAQDVFWGGYSGHFKDVEGYLWEVAYNPHGHVTDSGDFRIS